MSCHSVTVFRAKHVFDLIKLCVYFEFSPCQALFNSVQALTSRTSRTAEARRTERRFGRSAFIFKQVVTDVTCRAFFAAKHPLWRPWKLSKPAPSKPSSAIQRPRLNAKLPRCPRARAFPYNNNCCYLRCTLVASASSDTVGRTEFRRTLRCLPWTF